MKRKTRQGKALEKRAARSFMDVLQEVTLSYKFVSCHVYILIVGYLKDFYSGTVTGKSRIPASSCPNIFEGYSGSTEHLISAPLLLSLWEFCKLHMREMWDTILLMPLSSNTQWHSLPEICGLIDWTCSRYVWCMSTPWRFFISSPVLWSEGYAICVCFILYLVGGCS